ncbi:prepilin-type N-terminal cleavage/methylation domain-containing protein [Aquisalimonas sp.]|nr:prepilin-type N-terminal cleavage/methylation domain-containing protein [Aquisalimonas sp.]
MRKLNGFTLIELMVTVVVAAILLTVGVPSFQYLLQNSRL